MAPVKAVSMFEEVPVYYTIAPEAVPAMGTRRSRPVLLASAVAVACLAALTLGPQAAAAPVVLAETHSSVVDKIHAEVKAFESRIHSLQSEHSKKAWDGPWGVEISKKQDRPFYLIWLGFPLLLLDHLSRDFYTYWHSTKIPVTDVFGDF